MLGAQKLLLRNPVNARTMIADRDVAASLSACRTFASVDEQCNRMASARGTQQSDCAQSLRHAIDAGLFVSLPESRDIICRLASSTVPRSIEAIAIPTRNRPKLLERILSQLHQNLSLFERNPQIIVLDDSDNSAAQQANTEVIAGQSRLSGRRVLQIDKKTKQRLIAQLAIDTGISSGCLEFALGGGSDYPVSPGSARNTLLLSTVGRRVLFLDDDIQCSLALVPGYSERVTLGGSGTESWFFEGEKEIEQSCLVVEDIVGLHEKVMNFGALDMVENLATISMVDSHAMFRRIGSGEARVMATQMGIYGDCGVDSPLTSYLSGPQTWSRLVNSEGLYRAAIKNRLILRAPANFVLTNVSHTQAHCLAVDNTDCIPPFLPMLRGEDGVFGLLLARCVPNSLFGLIPRAILHSPDRVREFTPQAAISSAGRFTVSETIMALICTLGPSPGGTSTQRLASLGRSLQELRCARDEELQDLLQSAFEPLLIRVVQLMQARLDKCDAVAFWKNDLEQIRDSALAGLNSRNQLKPVDLEDEPGGVGPNVRLRGIVSAFADLLQAWPALIQSAGRLGLTT